MTVIMDIAVVALRILLPVYAVVIVYQCYASMRRRRRPEKPLVMLHNEVTDLKIPVLFWENSLGRSKRSDIFVDDPAVSRNHCVLLRRKEGWFINDTDSKTGTFVNGKETEGRTQVYIDDKITVGYSTFTFKRGEEFHEKLGPTWFFSRVSDKPAIKPYKLLLLITLFHLFMSVEACYTNEVKNYEPMMVFACLAAVEWLFFFVSTVVLKRINFELESLALFLTGMGVMLLVRQELRSAYVQLIAAVGGMILFCVIIKVIENPDRIAKFRLFLMILAVCLLGVSIVFGKISYGAANWISIGGISIQPSEFVKIIYILVGASSLDVMQTKKNLIEFILFSAVCVGGLALMGDFGTALIFFATFLLMAFMRSGDWKTVVLAVSAAVFGSTIVLKFKPYIANRFKIWGHAMEHPQDDGFQMARVLTYIASGGLFGVGIGNGCLKYVFASESDLVFGIVAEEMGVIVAFTVAIAIAALIIYARSVTTRSRSTFYSVTACCAAGLLVIQMSLNIFGATDILPLTGVTLPFISLGGSSMMSCWGLIAFIKAADERTYAVKS
ncbi:MAG: FtsW/RodA/SpoVE family cell cycle protein [Oscillospiraceae bacterium]|nr:FtsW/RodA/SpoVE family cell cycle protein [Oscillospiraceae bacterium]